MNATQGSNLRARPLEKNTFSLRPVSNFLRNWYMLANCRDRSLAKEKNVRFNRPKIFFKISIGYLFLETCLWVKKIIR